MTTKNDNELQELTAEEASETTGGAIQRVLTITARPVVSTSLQLPQIDASVLQRLGADPLLDDTHGYVVF